VRFAVAVHAVAVRAIPDRGSCCFFTDKRKPWRRVPTFPDYNGYHTLSNSLFMTVRHIFEISEDNHSSLVTHARDH
jgi:hypothetical protein